jgi:hypothetical protein
MFEENQVRQRVSSLVTVLAALAMVGGVASSAELAEQLKAEGIEPTKEGVQAYLNSRLPKDDGKTVDALIADLAHEEFSVREQASKRLTGMKAEAHDRLEKATKSDNPERAYRAKLILDNAQTRKDSTLSRVLGFVRQEKLALELPLLLEIQSHVAQGDEQEAVVQAMTAIVTQADREAISKLLKGSSPAKRNSGRLLLAALDQEAAKPLLEGSFDAVTVNVGSVSGGGPNLICGWEFEPKVDLVVTGLGILDLNKDGLHLKHEVAIWDVDDKKSPVALATVREGQEAALSGVFRFATVERAKLKAGRRYAVVAHYADPSDGAVGLLNPSGLTVDYASHFQVNGRRYSFPHKTMAFPSKLTESPQHASLGPSFRYDVSSESLTNVQPSKDK